MVSDIGRNIKNTGGKGMTAEEYVKKIVKKVMCNKQKKKDIQRQLLAEIEERVSGGEELESVIAQMGSITEIAESFNDNISNIEKKRYRNKKLIKVVIPMFIVLFLFLALLYWVLPKASEISSSKIFTESEVKDTLMDTIDLLDNGDYEELRNKATSKMAIALKKDLLDSFKKKLCDSWGERQIVGTIYTLETVQMGVHYATCQVNVAYENVNVTYTISFDKNMKIAGLYMK